MKKYFALLLLLVLIALAFSACQAPTVTEKKTRWDNAESWTYNISLADFETTLTQDSGTYNRDFLYVGEASPASDKVDRIVPESLTGTYTITISVDGASNTAKVTTNQTMYSTYNTDTVAALVEKDHPKKEEIEITQDTDSNTTTLCSVTVTEVVFQNVPAQTPISSKTSVKGFYVGKRYQDWSIYTLETTYEAVKKGFVAKVSRDGGEAVENKIDSATVIDNNQVLTYVRSFDKGESTFQDAPNVAVYNPLNNTTNTLTFNYTYKQNFCLPHVNAGGESVDVATQLNRLDVILGGLPLLTQVCLPNLTAKSIDAIPSSDVPGVYFPKHTIVRFRVGYVAFQLQNYLTDTIVDAVKVA